MVIIILPKHFDQLNYSFCPLLSGFGKHNFNLNLLMLLLLIITATILCMFVP